MVENRVGFEQMKFILKCYWKYDNIVNVQRWFRIQLKTDPVTRFIIEWIKDKFEAGEAFHNVHEQRRMRTSMNVIMEKRIYETKSKFKFTSLVNFDNHCNLKPFRLYKVTYQGTIWFNWR